MASKKQKGPKIEVDSNPRTVIPYIDEEGDYCIEDDNGDHWVLAGISSEGKLFLYNSIDKSSGLSLDSGGFVRVEKE